jgi:hypothetical protein
MEIMKTRLLGAIAFCTFTPLTIASECVNPAQNTLEKLANWATGEINGVYQRCLSSERADLERQALDSDYFGNTPDEEYRKIFKHQVNPRIETQYMLGPESPINNSQYSVSRTRDNEQRGIETVKGYSTKQP